MANTNAIGKIVGDYIVVDKINEKKQRSKYKLKCTICDSILETYNIPKDKKHSEYCTNFIHHIFGEKIGDYIIIRAYREDRVYVDIVCIVCGAKRTHVAYRDFKSVYKNKHGKHCTIHNTDKYKNKKIVRKLLRTFNSINQRIKNDPSYHGIESTFIDSVDFVTHMYPLYYERIKDGVDLKELSIDRIDTTKGYYKDNVRCLTIAEQQHNKKNSREYYVGDIKFTRLRDFCNKLNLPERDFYKTYNNRNIARYEFEYNNMRAVVYNKYVL